MSYRARRFQAVIKRRAGQLAADEEVERFVESADAEDGGSQALTDRIRDEPGDRVVVDYPVHSVGQRSTVGDLMLRDGHVREPSGVPSVEGSVVRYESLSHCDKSPDPVFRKILAQLAAQA
jgi:hypothetical protein